MDTFEVTVIEKECMKMYSICRSTIYRIGILTVCLLLAGVSMAYASKAAVQVINTSGGGWIRLTVRNVSDNEVADEGRITWSNAQAGSTAWNLAGQYIELYKLPFPEFWGFQMYTDNTNVAATPRYTGTGNPAGLVKVTNPIMTLPMAWRITDHVLSAAELSDPAERSDATGFTDYMWHYMKDKHTPDRPYTPADETFVNGSEYVTLWNQAGIAWNEGARAHNPKRAYIYLAANFSMASVNTDYDTSELIIEAYHDGVSPFPLYLYRDYNSLENHFAPSGFMNYYNQNISVDSNCTEVTPHSGTSCMKITWNGKNGIDGYYWAGVMWLEPEDVWDEIARVGAKTPEEKKAVVDSLPENGYDLKGADYITFWARTDSANQGLQLKVWYGNAWDSCGETSGIWRSPSLTTAWQQYLINIGSLLNMSKVTGGLGIVFADDHDPDPNGCVIYIDDIRYDRY